MNTVATVEILIERRWFRYSVLWLDGSIGADGKLRQSARQFGPFFTRPGARHFAAMLPIFPDCHNVVLTNDRKLAKRIGADGPDCECARCSPWLYARATAPGSGAPL